MNEKPEILIGGIVAILVVSSLVVYFLTIRTVGALDLVSGAIIVIIIALAIYILWDRTKNIRKGLPAKDERLTTISYRAGYYGFIAAIWTAVAAPVIADILLGRELEGHLVTALVVLTSALVFMLSYFYLAWKGHTA